MSEQNELTDNGKLEASIKDLQENMTPEQLAVTLTNVRRSMKENAQVIVPVQPVYGAGPQVASMDLEDGKWLYVFTSFEEQKYSQSKVQSTFLGSLDQVARMADGSTKVQGVILNPYHLALRLDKTYINIILGK